MAASGEIFIFLMKNIQKYFLSKMAFLEGIV